MGRSVDNRRGIARRRAGLLALALVSPALAWAAAVVPGSPEAERPPVETAPPAETSATGEGLFGGITLAPIRWWGNVALDLRYRGGEGTPTTDTQALSATGYYSTFIWQPWIARVNGSVGGILTRDGGSENGGSATSVAAIGDVDISLFPQSRFPFTLYAGISDSRASGATTDFDYRDYRLRLSQQYQHPERSERYWASYEQSILRSAQSGGFGSNLSGSFDDTDPATTTDRLRVLRAGWARNWATQSLEVDGSLARNRSRSGPDLRRSVFDFASLRHAYNPSSSLSVSTTASLSRNENEFLDSRNFGALSFANTFLQVNSFATYRPQEGDYLYVEDHPVNVTATLRAFRTTQDSGEFAAGTSFGGSGSIGITYDLRRDLQLFSSTQAFFTEGISGARGVLQSVGLNYFPEPIPLGEYRYTWNASTSVTAGASNADEDPRFVGVQGALGHTLSREWNLDGRGSLSMTVTQGVAARVDTRDDPEEALTHTLGLYWTQAGDGARRGYAAVSLSDTRRFGREKGSFQLANFQATIQENLSRRSYFSGSITLQATRSDFEPLRVGDDGPVIVDPDRGRWRFSAGGNLTYTHGAVFGVPRLQFLSILQADTYSLRRREQGDFDAPPEQVNWSWENRLDYAIGRLFASLIGRIAEVEGRGRQWQVYFRVQRNFGDR